MSLMIKKLDALNNFNRTLIYECFLLVFYYRIRYIKSIILISVGS